MFAKFERTSLQFCHSLFNIDLKFRFLLGLFTCANLTQNGAVNNGLRKKLLLRQTRRETFDQIHFFRCRQREGESLEVFHSRIRKKPICIWDYVEENLAKSVLIQGMNKQQIQMNLLSEDR